VSRAALAVVGVVVAVIATARVAHAGGDFVMYKVQQGDGLKLIAAEYYGNRDDYIFIMTANKMDHPRVLKPGERLKIPVNRDVIATPGQTFAELAKAYLDDERRAPFLAQFNNMSPEDTIPAGTVITVPLHVTHVAAANEALADVAAAYFADRKQAALLRDFNFLDHDTLTKGESIMIPIRRIKVRSGKLPEPDDNAKALADKLAATTARVKTALPRARKAATAGDFDTVTTELADIDLDYLDADVAAEAGLLLGEATLADDQQALTIATFKRVLARKPGLVLDVYTYSPKVRDAWKKAGGAVEGDK